MLPATPPDTDVELLHRHGYFVIQADACTGRKPLEVRGIVEDLRTGEKHEFDSPVAVARILEQWGQRQVDPRFGKGARDPAPAGESSTDL